MQQKTGMLELQRNLIICNYISDLQPGIGSRTSVLRTRSGLKEVNPHNFVLRGCQQTISSNNWMQICVSKISQGLRLSAKCEQTLNTV